MTDLKTAVLVSVVTLLSLSGASAQVAANRTHGEVCNEMEHCRTNSGLICTDGLCACSNGKLNDKYNYGLEWVAADGRCLSKLGSVCIGTPQMPTPRGQLECIGGRRGTTRCVQVPDLPLGVGTCQPPPITLQLHGQPCTEMQHCNASVGLICSETTNTCACASGILTQSHEYKLLWSEDKGRCVANVGSACVGTRETPLSTAAKQIECVPHNSCINVGPAGSAPRQGCTFALVHCEQIGGLPLGIGLCTAEPLNAGPEEPGVKSSSAPITKTISFLTFFSIVFIVISTL